MRGQAFVYAWLAAFIIWEVWAAVGIVRCAIRTAADPRQNSPLRASAIVAMILTAVFVVFTVRDLAHLFDIG
jgi:hypothetical protein